MKEMTSLERVQAVLHGQIPDRLPVIPQGFMFSAKTAGYHIGEINRNLQKMAESHRISQEKYGYDGCVIDVDDATLAEACGAKVLFRDKDVASVDEHNPAIKDLRDIDTLHMPDPLKDGRICEWLETTQRLCDMIGDRVFIMGRADQGPFSLLALLRGAQNFMIDLMTQDEAVIRHALDWATEAHTRFAKAQLQTGAHCTSMGDAYAGPNLIAPASYRKYAFQYEKQVVDSLRAFDKAYAVHICGNASKIVADMGQLGAQILELDWKTDMGLARSSVPDNVTLMGNVNPSDPMYLGEPESVLRIVRENVEKTKGKGLIISSGCALGEDTKAENMRALIESAKLYGSYEQLCALQN